MRLDEPKRREASVSNPKPHTHMEYTLSPNAQQAIASLRDLDGDTIDRYAEWCESRLERLKHSLLRQDQAYEQRLKFLHHLMDVEAVWREVVREYDRRSAEALATA